MRASLSLMLAVTFLHAAGAEGMPDRDLKEARRLYQAKCSRCHKFYEPSKYGPEEWGEWMEKMRVKSKLKPRQFELVEHYTGLLRTGAVVHPDKRGRWTEKAAKPSK